MKRGFSLVEILLALLVVGVGVVALTGLLSSTLDTGIKSRDDLDVVSFADMVLDYCHATEDWSALATGGAIATLDHDENEISLPIGGVHRFTSVTAGKDGAVRERFTVTYSLDVRNEGRVKTLSLRVWPGPSPRGRPRVFQTEIYDWNHTHAATNE